MKTLLIYYSRTGKTESAMKEIADRLGADMTRITDGKSRKGVLGFLGAGMEAVSGKPGRLLPVALPAPLADYDLVVVGGPVWAGRPVPVIRTFLQQYGKEIRRAAWLLTRAGTNGYEGIFDDMDGFAGVRRAAQVSLQPGENLYRDKLDSFIGELSGGEAR